MGSEKEGESSDFELGKKKEEPRNHSVTRVSTQHQTDTRELSIQTKVQAWERSEIEPLLEEIGYIGRELEWWDKQGEENSIGNTE